MTEIVKTEGGGVITGDFAKRLMAGIADSRSSTIIAGGKPFLRMLKSSEWVFGPSDEEVQPGSQWIVNIVTLRHGWCCWVENELKGEVETSMAEHKPPRPAPIDGVEFKEQRSFELKCATGDDAGTEVIYKTNSLGGMRAVDELLGAIHGALARDPEHAFPVLTLGSDHYNHKTYGRIYTPTLSVVGWADMNGNMARNSKPAIAPQQEEEEQAAPARKRKSPLAVAPDASEKAAGPIPTAQGHTGQRRRPGAQPAA